MVLRWHLRAWEGAVQGSGERTAPGGGRGRDVISVISLKPATNLLASTLPAGAKGAERPRNPSAPRGCCPRGDTSAGSRCRGRGATNEPGAVNEPGSANGHAAQRTHVGRTRGAITTRVNKAAPRPALLLVTAGARKGMKRGECPLDLGGGHVPRPAVCSPKFPQCCSRGRGAGFGPLCGF